VVVVGWRVGEEGEDICFLGGAGGNSSGISFRGRTRGIRGVVTEIPTDRDVLVQLVLVVVGGASRYLACCPHMAISQGSLE
jgi:hypothetical protein